MAQQRRSRADYEQGLPDYHDPTAGWAGAPAARSALTLRAVLAAIGLLLCAPGAVFAALAGLVPLAALLGLGAAIAVVDLGWVLYRKRRGEPG